MEVLPGVHRVSTTLGPRFMHQYILVGHRVVLIDTGVADTPETVIFPYLRSIGVDPARINLVINTHPDVDHVGGNAAVRRAAPGCLFACHVLDREQVEDRPTLMALRYDCYDRPHGIRYPEEARQQFLRLMGESLPMDILLQGGEELHIGGGRRFRLLHVPGHSHGHLGLWDPEHQAAIVNDAVLGKGLYDVDYQMSMPPTYLYPEEYLSTVQTLQLLNPRQLFLSHFDVQEGAQVQEFLAESRGFVERLDQHILNVLESASEPVTMRAIIEAAEGKLGAWSREANWDLSWPLSGHLARLERIGRIRRTEQEGRVAYVVAR